MIRTFPLVKLPLVLLMTVLGREILQKSQTIVFLVRVSNSCDADRGIKEVTVGTEKFIRCDGTKANNVFINSVRSTDGNSLHFYRAEIGDPCLSIAS